MEYLPLVLQAATLLVILAGFRYLHVKESPKETDRRLRSLEDYRNGKTEKWEKQFSDHDEDIRGLRQDLVANTNAIAALSIVVAQLTGELRSGKHP